MLRLFGDERSDLRGQPFLNSVDIDERTPASCASSVSGGALSLMAGPLIWVNREGEMRAPES